jgi:hypothetical protein
VAHHAAAVYLVRSSDKPCCNVFGAACLQVVSKDDGEGRWKRGDVGIGGTVATSQTRSNSVTFGAGVEDEASMPNAADTGVVVMRLVTVTA